MKRKILISGLGSIGKRHLKNLIKLGYKNISIVSRNGKIKANYEQYKFYKSITDASLKENFDTLIISTPTSNHLIDLMEALENNIVNIYLEKPISNSLDDINKVKHKLESLNVNLVIGYDLRFDPGLILLKNYIDSNKIGRTLGFISEVGQYLPDWRSEIDYRYSMSAQKRLGGGVMLDLVHEFDYVNWIVGPIKSIAGINKKNSSLDIDTEDISVNLIETTSGVIGSIHLDYLQFELTRRFKIIGEKGVIIWDYSKSILKLMLHQDRIWSTHNYNKLNRNDRFIDIIEAFMISNSNQIDKRLVRFNEAIKSLELVEMSKNFNNRNFKEEE